MYKLNLNKDVKIEEMKINVCFLEAYFNDANRFMHELLVNSKKFLNVWKINVL